MANRLASESSPYLRQHADNPVDWYPWNAEALARARAENKPILLSIGYAACHWCHVMAHESFEDVATAALMNELYVNIKVDREERPDLDSIYMQAVQSMTGHGGWPMTVFLTPDGEPFWGGTYFPPDDRMGMPSFQRVLKAVADSYRNRPEQVEKAVGAMRDLYETTSRTVPAGELSRATLERAFSAASATYDAQFGGFGGAPKFPPTMLLEFLLTHWARTGDSSALHIAHDTFSAMAAGGLHDHIGGGFHRYTVDRHWLVPHFEKMLYDNALLARFGAHLWQATGDENVKQAVEGIVRWVEREMTSPEGGFYASLDADSEGHEGLFYTWTSSEIDAVAGPHSKAFREWFGITNGGNFEGRNILHVPAGSIAFAPREVREVAHRLYDVRAKRVWPGLDNKIVVGWNGLMLRAVALCARVFGRDDWKELAHRNGMFFLLTTRVDGVVPRIVARGNARTRGFLEDHAAMGLAFHEMWQLTGKRIWFSRAAQLADMVLEHFWDEDGGVFYDVSHDHETLITRPRDLFDNASPSGTSLAIDLLLNVGYVNEDERLTRIATAALQASAESAARYPHACGHALQCADRIINGTSAIAIAGDSKGAHNLAASIATAYMPSPLIAIEDRDDEDLVDLPIFRDRDARGAAASAYFCRGTSCEAPTSDSAVLRTALANAFPAKPQRGTS